MLKEQRANHCFLSAHWAKKHKFAAKIFISNISNKYSVSSHHGIACANVFGKMESLPNCKYFNNCLISRADFV